MPSSDGETNPSMELLCAGAMFRFLAMAEIEYQYKPTIESLHKLQDILTRKLGRGISLEETEIAYHELMGYAFAVTDMASDSLSSLSVQPIAALTNAAYTVA